MSEMSSSIWHPYTQMKLAKAPVRIVRGKGAILYDNQDKEYIDAISSWWVNLHGHAHPYIIKKMHKQMKQLEHTIFAGFTHTPAITLSQNLLSVLPQNQEKVFFSDNGSTAVEVALKMAIQYWSNRAQPKQKIISFENAYHGDTFGAMSVSGRSGFTKPFLNHLFPVSYIEVPQKESHRDVCERLYSIVQTGEAAAFIFEPLVQGVAGMNMYEAEYLDELIGICRKHKVVTIADEVMTGFFRLGKMFASDFLQEKPDIICLSKGLTGGFAPMGITATTNEIFTAFFSSDKSKAFFHGHSYTGNPINCAAAMASLELLQKKSVRQKIKWIERSHSVFADTIQKHPLINKVVTRGTILALEIKTVEETSYFNRVRDTLYDFYLAAGVLLRPLGNIVYIMPPYCISNKQLDKVYSVIESSMQMLQDSNSNFHPSGHRRPDTPQ